MLYKSNSIYSYLNQPGRKQIIPKTLFYLHSACMILLIRLFPVRHLLVLKAMIPSHRSDSTACKRMGMQTQGRKEPHHTVQGPATSKRCESSFQFYHEGNQWKMRRECQRKQTSRRQGEKTAKEEWYWNFPRMNGKG